MIFYVSWNHALSYYEYMDQVLNCPKCQSEQTMQIRVYVDKTKLYGLATVSKKYSGRSVCRNCLTEFKLEKALEKEVLIRFKADLEVAKAREKEAKKGKKVDKEATPDDVPCERCGKPIAAPGMCVDCVEYTEWKKQMEAKQQTQGKTSSDSTDTGNLHT